MNKPDKLYAVCMNLRGINPKVMTLKYNPELDCWYDRSGNWGARMVGLNETRGYITFASEDKATAEVFLSGALAVRRMLAEWVS